MQNDSDQLLSAARRGEKPSFDRLLKPHRRELHAHCYRMLGSVQDAEDALQESLMAAWNGLPTFQGRSSLRSWLYTICTHCCLRLVSQRPKRLLSSDYGPAFEQTSDLGQPVLGPVWVEPWLDSALAATSDEIADPSARYLGREGLELAFVAALQHLPGTQRAALILCDVLEFSAAEAAEALSTSVPSLNSALQRARKTLSDRRGPAGQRAELDALGSDGQRALVSAFVGAWERGDVDGIVKVLSEDARFSMPPLPAWFSGRDAVARFFAERVFATPWRLVPLRPNGQLGFACYVQQPGASAYTLGAVNVLSLRAGQISWIAGFLDPALHRALGVSATPE